MDTSTSSTTNIGRSLGTDYFRIADQLTEQEIDYLAPHQGFRRRRGAPGDQRLLGAGGDPVAADQAAGRVGASSARASRGTAARR